MQIGDLVEYADEYGNFHTALVTNIFGGEDNPATAINLVYVSENENEIDQYGRQLKRETSVVPRVNQSAHGRYWRPMGEFAVS